MGSLPTTGEPASGIEMVDAPAAIPAWLAARRSRTPSLDNDQPAPEPVLQTEPVSAREMELPDAEAGSAQIPVIVVDQSSTTFGQDKKTIWQRMNEATAKGAPFWVVIGVWFTQLGHQYGSAMIGAGVSMAAHAVAIVSLAVIFISGGMDNQGLNIFGVFSTSNESEMADLDLDSSLQVDPGRDAAPLEFPDLSQAVSPNAAGIDSGESLRGALNGTGTSDGAGGDGEAMQVPAVNVPSYAVSKGSFSAWTEPRDPDPGRQYIIVIQVRVPGNIKKYRASDLTGMVIGTDLYKQAIKFRSTEEFAIKDGAVQVRIPVPGAAKLVRDTIRIESRLLREKQTIQIEF